MTTKELIEALSQVPDFQVLVEGCDCSRLACNVIVIDKNILIKSTDDFEYAE